MGNEMVLYYFSLET